LLVGQPQESGTFKQPKNYDRIPSIPDLGLLWNIMDIAARILTALSKIASNIPTGGKQDEIH